MCHTDGLGHQQRPEGVGGAAGQKAPVDKVKSGSPLERELEPRLKRRRGTFYELGLLLR